MKAKLLIDGKEIEVEISEEEYKKLQPKEKNKTGYERVSENIDFYSVSARGDVEIGNDSYSYIDNEYYDIANYYSSEIVAENNARADKLMRQMRRFSVEYRKNEIDWNDYNSSKYYINYDFDTYKLCIDCRCYIKDCMTIYFDSRTIAEAAIDEFRDELIWYFTEYKDSL